MMKLIKEHIIGLKRNIFGHTLELLGSILIKIITEVSVNVVAYTLANSSTYFVTYSTHYPGSRFSIEAYIQGRIVSLFLAIGTHP